MNIIPPTLMVETTADGVAPAEVYDTLAFPLNVAVAVIVFVDLCVWFALVLVEATALTLEAPLCNSPPLQLKLDVAVILADPRSNLSPCTLTENELVNTARTLMTVASQLNVAVENKFKGDWT